MTEKESIERYVPALRATFDDPDEGLSEITARVVAVLPMAVAEMTAHFGVSSLVALHAGAGAQIVDAVRYKLAALRSLPSLDLVANGTGFSVVSNQNLAPASRHRVDALREELRRQVSDGFDAIETALIAAGETSRNFVSLLIHNSAIARRYGIQEGDAPMYREEFFRQRSKIADAEATLRRLISPELYGRLLLDVRDGRAVYPYGVITEHARRAVASIFHAGGCHSTPAVSVLLEQIERWAEQLPEYLHSSTYKKYHASRYENRADDPCYFM